MTLRELKDLVVEDWHAHGRPIASAGFHTVALHRFGQWAREGPPFVRSVANLLYLLASTTCRNIYGIELPLEVQLGRRVVFAHQGGTVIARHAVIGDDCLIRQNVTMGTDAHGSERHHPVLGARVTVGAGAVILGGVTVGDDVRIGPNAVVMKDVPAGSSAFANPARIMPPLRPADAPAES